jgi:hypothetical protein
MKYFIAPLAFFVFFACSQAPTEFGGRQKNQKPLVFQFSNKIATMDPKDPTNWCNAKYGQAVLISADPKNFHRRLFALGDLPIRVIIDTGHQTAAFMMYKQGNQIEISTSDNLPMCLSNKAGFQLSSDGLSFRYNNKRDISFDVYMQELTNGTQIALDLPPSGSHGMTVIPCKTCK